LFHRAGWLWNQASPAPAQINEELDTTVYDRAFGREMHEVFERFGAFKALHAGRLRETIAMKPIPRMVMLPFHSQVWAQTRLLSVFASPL
jgi:hypothetical protein